MSQLNVNLIKDTTGSGGGLEFQSSGNFAFKTASSTMLYIDSTNNRAGVGTTSPDCTFDVEGSEGVLFNTAPLMEKVVYSTGTLNGSPTIDVLSGGVHYFNGASTGNWTLNIRGDASTTFNDVMTTNTIAVVTTISANGGSSGYPTGFQIDGSNVTVEWTQGNAPSARGGTSGYDIYQYSILKYGNSAYRVFANQTYMN